MAAADPLFRADRYRHVAAGEADAVRLDEFKDKIELVDTEFSYDERKIIDGVSFEIPKGEMVAVVGETVPAKRRLPISSRASTT